MTSYNDALSDATYKFLQSHYKNEVMSLSGCKLTSIPPELFIFQEMKELSLSNNDLTSIPPELGQLLPNLQLLSLSNNQLTSIPKEIGQLVNLQVLNLYGNKLTSIPPELGQLTNLQVLNLSNNQLTSIPPELGQLVNLQVLHLSYNQLTSIPPELVQLTNLKIYGFVKPVSEIPNPFFVDELKALTKKALDERQKEADEYSSQWMTLYKEKFEEHLRQEAMKGNTQSIFYYEPISYEKCIALQKRLKDIYKGLSCVFVNNSYVNVSWV